MHNLTLATFQPPSTQKNNLFFREYVEIALLQKIQSRIQLFMPSFMN
jgi:hypothetical protein